MPISFTSFWNPTQQIWIILWRCCQIFWILGVGEEPTLLLLTFYTLYMDIGEPSCVKAGASGWPIVFGCNLWHSLNTMFFYQLYKRISERSLNLNSVLDVCGNGRDLNSYLGCKLKYSFLLELHITNPGNTYFISRVKSWRILSHIMHVICYMENHQRCAGRWIT